MAQQAAFKETSYGGEVFTTNMSVGEILRRSRVHYNQTLQDIERELHIKPPQIEAMESDRFDLLPGRVYAIGFVRAYSEYLGLDGNKMVSLFKQQSHGGFANNPGLSSHHSVSSDNKVPSIWIIAGSLIVLAAAAVVWGAYSFSGQSATVRDIPPVPQDLRDLQNSQTSPYMPQPAAPQVVTMGPPAPDASGLSDMQPAAGTEVFGPPVTQAAVVTPEAQGEVEAAVEPEVEVASAEQTPAPEAASPAVPASKGMILKVVSDSWVEIKDGKGQTLVSRVLKGGEQYFIPNRPGLSLSAGNGAALAFEIDGQRLNPLGKDGEIIRDLQLDLNYLKTHYAAAQSAAN